MIEPERGDDDLRAPPSETSFLEELKRRKIVRVAVVYLAVAWAVVQVADVFVPALGLSDRLVTAVALLVILGFPLAMVLTWAFELTSEGVKRTAPGGGPAQTGWVGARTVAAAAVLLGMGYVAGTVLEPGVGSASSLDRRAIAVLPFESRGVQDEEGFAEGMHEDLLTQLSRIDALRVTSRTSVQEYRATTKNMRQIAAELGVGTLLEGGVQRTADRVRVNIQLIDGATDEHLWAETYDRELTAENVFAIQSEIARAVAAALEATLTPQDEEELDAVPTRSVAALDLYHRGRRLYFGLGGRSDDRSHALTVFEEAVEEDPGFVQAWSMLAQARAWQIREGRSGDTLPPREALARVEALAPGTLEEALARGAYLYYGRYDLEGALAAFRRADAIQAGNTDVLFAMASVLRRLGRFEESAAMFEEVVRLEPRDTRALYDLADLTRVQGRFDESEAWLRRHRALAPDIGLFALRVELAFYGRGDLDRAEALLAEWMASPSRELAVYYRVLLDYLRRRPSSAADVPPLPGGGVHSFQSYTLVPDGPVELWKARLLWVEGDRAGAREASRGLGDAFLATLPALAAGANVNAPGQDVFGHRGGLLLVRAWESLFAGEGARALRLADEALALHNPAVDAVDGDRYLRHRAMIRTLAGDPDGAVDDLRTLLSGPSPTSVWELRLDPLYDSLRDRPDFQALVAGAP